jgi:hypothetical protein
MYGVLLMVGILVLFLIINLLHYSFAKAPRQKAMVDQSHFDLIPLPAGSRQWEPAEENFGDPLDDYLRIQLDFRARERDYIAAKLRNVPLPNQTFNFAAVDMFLLAASRPLSISETTLERELLLRPDDLRDAASVLLKEAERLEKRATRSDLSQDEIQADLLRAENLLLAHYRTGLYLATRRFLLKNQRVGIMLMRDGVNQLYEFYIRQGRTEQANAADAIFVELKPLADRLDEIISYQDDDLYLEVWINMLTKATAASVRLFAAQKLASTATCWWRYAESARAIQSLRRSVMLPANRPLRGYLFDLIHAIETSESPVRHTGVSEASDEWAETRRWVDSLF